MNNRWRAVVLGAAFGVIALGAMAQDVPTVDEAWQAKVDPWVLATAHQGKTEFLVVLAEQTDLSQAAEVATKEEKGELVAFLLQQTAERTQGPILAALARLGAETRSFWIANMIWVRGDHAAVRAMAERTDVARVHANPEVPIRLPQSEAHAPAPDAPEAIEWNITKTGAPSVWNLGFKGAGVVVGGQDTGYQWDHPALKGKYRGWNGSTANHNYNWHDGIHPGNPCATSPTPFDDHGHGTHTMGTMVGDDGGSNQIGMAPQAKWIGCRNMDAGNGTPASYADCFQFFMAPTDLSCQNPDPTRAPHVINNSWGCTYGEGCTEPNILKTVVENTRAAGIVVVVSAGNSGSGCASVSEPAAIYDASFTVGATDSSDGIASFSSRGPVTVDGSNRLKPEVSAPGVSIRSSVPGGTYEGGWSGTSMAGPHVAGQVALMLSAMPGWKGQVDAVEGRITQTAVPLTSAQSCGGVPGTQIPNNTFGYGRIDALAAVSMADLYFYGFLDTPDPVGVGQQLTYQVFLGNNGPVTATGASVQVTLPAGVTFVSASSGCAHASGVVTCSFGTVVKGTYPDKSIVVTTTVAGSMTAAATLTGTLFDHNLGNNQAFAPTTVGDGANLALTKTEPYDPALLGAPFTYTLTASNLGPSPVTSATLVDTLPAAASFLIASPGCTHDAGTVTCALGSLASGSSTQVSITVTPTGSLTNSAVVSSELLDPVLANNTASVTTAVVAATPAGLDVDTHVGGTRSLDAGSDVNGVLEPGETVLAVPTWHNPSAGPAVLTASASTFSGPGSGTYTLTDSTADFGTVAAGTSQDCWSAGGNCLELQLDTPATRPANHWDATFTDTLSTGASTVRTVHVGDSFADVARSHWAYRYIETIFHSSVTAGCNTEPFNYCPGTTLTRAEMAVLLLKAEHGPAWTPPLSTGTVFTDVPIDHWAGDFIEQLAAEGITGGCDVGLYCPDAPITRAEMAVFLIKAEHGTGYVPPISTGTVFTDVPIDHWAGDFIEQLAAEAITGGCDAGLYCPTGIVTRAEMAVFLTKTFGLQLNS